MDRRTKLYSLYSEGYEPLRDVFLNSIRDDFDVRLRHCPLPPANFGSRHYGEIIVEKVRMLQDALREADGETLAYSDIDIQFFGPVIPELEALLGERDILFLTEYPGKKAVNTGFFFARSNLRVRTLFDALLRTDFHDGKKWPFFDQSVLNVLLPRARVRHGLLDGRFYSPTHGPDLPHGILLHHATCTFARIEDGRKVSSLDLKLAQLDDVRRRVEARATNANTWDWPQRVGSS